MSQPRVSVLLPAYNAERFLAEAMDSILEQTFVDMELIVVDDGSADKTAAIVRDYCRRDARVRLIECAENGGIARALNAGLEVVHGDYVVRMDSDDWSFPHRIATQVQFMDEHPEVDVCGSAIEVCDSELKPLNIRRYQETDEAIRWRLFFYSPFAHPAVIYRTSAARRVGGYNPDLSDADDYDFFLRLGRSGKFANLPEVLHRLRTRSDSVSQARGVRTERLTIFVRVKAAFEYGYEMPPSAAIYTMLQFVSSFVIPIRMKFWMFNWLRTWRDQ